MTTWTDDYTRSRSLVVDTYDIDDIIGRKDGWPPEEGIPTASGGVDILQEEYEDTTLSGVYIVTHEADPLRKRLVQVFEAQTGASGVVDNSLDFDLVDEGDYIQEDSVSGTNFVDGVVELYNSGGTAADLSEGSFYKEGTYNESTAFARGFTMGNNGTKVYTCNNVTNTRAYEFTLSTPYDVSTATYVRETINLVNSPEGVEISTDGTVLFITGNIDTIYAANLTAAWNATFSSWKGNYDVSTDGISNVTDLFVRADGLQIFALSTTDKIVMQYTLSSINNPSTATLADTFDVSGTCTDPRSMTVSSDGSILYVYDISTDIIHEFIMGTSWDLTTVTGTSNSLDISAKTNASYALHVESDEQYIYAFSGPELKAYQYFMPLSSEYISTASYYVTTSDTNHLSMDTVYTINSVVISGATPVDTTLGVLVSFDGRTIWNYWDGNYWSPHAGLTITSGWSTISGIEAGLANYTVSGTDTYLDFAFLLETTDSGVTPSIDQITINYDEDIFYNKLNVTEYSVAYTSSTSTEITKLTSGTDDIKVNIILGV